jgi:hypothetical protein
MSLLVIHEHVVTGEYPDASQGAWNAAGDLVITDPDGVPHVHPGTEVGAWGWNLVCAFTTPRADCPRCHPELAAPARAEAPSTFRPGATGPGEG